AARMSWRLSCGRADGPVIERSGQPVQRVAPSPRMARIAARCEVRRLGMSRSRSGRGGAPLVRATKMERLRRPGKGGLATSQRLEVQLQGLTGRQRVPTCEQFADSYPHTPQLGFRDHAAVPNPMLGEVCHRSRVELRCAPLLPPRCPLAVEEADHKLRPERFW